MRHRDMLRAGVVSWGLFCGGIFAASALAAEPRPDKRAEVAIQQALREGLEGRPQNRNRLLREAVEAAPERAAAHWHLGEIKLNHKWVSIEEIPALAEQNPKLIKYRSLRKETPDTAVGQLQLATWCAGQGLADEERAHLTRVLVHEPEHPQVRARLGFRMVAGEWISKEEQDLSAARQQAAIAGMRKWEARIQAIKKGFLAEGLKVRETALERARAIDDPAAVSALEFVLAPAGEQPSMLVVDVIGRIKGLDAARALGRLAIVSPWQVVRNSAAQQLKSRPQDSFVPAMLSTLYSPIQSRASLFQSPDGRLMYRHLFYREGQEQRQLAVLDTEYRHAGGDADGAMAMALMSVDFTVRQREAAVAQQSRITAELNDRIFRSLQIATGESLTNDTDAWWKWWSEQNEVFLPQKGERGFYNLHAVDVVGLTEEEENDEDNPQNNTLPERSTPAVFRFANFGFLGMSSCLAAGTPIVTEQGLVAIDKIQVGDRVLSQNPQTGELAYKPVLRTTLTRASRLRKLHFGSETIEATAGHLFWEPGKGWAKASTLAADSKLHQPAGTIAVVGAEEGKFDFTYNLVVGDFHTYFVGKSQILSHDVTRHEATEALVPGLVERR